MLKKLLATTAATLALGLASASSIAQNINFGIISTEATQNLKQDWAPLIEDMKRQTGFNVTAFFAPDYAGIIEGMRFNKVQVAWLVLKNGKSLSFGNGDPNSTSGYLVPGFYVFAKNKIDAKTHFRITRGANHEANALAVANKQVDVATNNSENLDKIQQRYPDKFKNIKIVWTSPLIPLDPLVMRKDLSDANKAKLRAFFYNYGKTDVREKEVLMKISKLSGFKESTNRQLLPIRQLELFSQRNKAEADTSMNDADKNTRLADIDKQLAALN